MNNNFTLIVDPNFQVSIYEGGNSIFLGKRVYCKAYDGSKTIREHVLEGVGALELLNVKEAK